MARTPHDCSSSPEHVRATPFCTLGTHPGRDLSWIPDADPGIAKTCIFSEITLGLRRFQLGLFDKKRFSRSPQGLEKGGIVHRGGGVHHVTGKGGLSSIGGTGCTGGGVQFFNGSLWFPWGGGGAWLARVTYYWGWRLPIVRVLWRIAFSQGAKLE